MTKKYETLLYVVTCKRQGDALSYLTLHDSGKLFFQSEVDQKCISDAIATIKIFDAAHGQNMRDVQIIPLIEEAPLSSDGENELRRTAIILEKRLTPFEVDLIMRRSRNEPQS